VGATSCHCGTLSPLSLHLRRVDEAGKGGCLCSPPAHLESTNPSSTPAAIMGDSGTPADMSVPPPPPPSWEMRLPYSRSAGPAAEPRLRARCPVPSLCFISWRRVCSCPCLACVLTCSSHIVQQQAWSKAFLPPAPPTATLPLHQSHSLTHVHPSHITQGQACRQSVTQLTPKVLLPPSQGSH
jgi:hypothetical protein